MSIPGVNPEEMATFMREEMQRMYPELEASILRKAVPPSGGTGRSSELRPPKPAKFNGTKVDLQEVTVWLFGLESYFTACHVMGNPERMAFASAMLEGPAQAWWMTLVLRASEGEAPVPDTWAEFRLALTQRFQPINAGRAARDRLHALRQVNTVASYASIFQELLLKCPDIGMEDQKHRFIYGLKPHVQHGMLNLEPTDLNAAISMAERLDNNLVRSPFRPSYGSTNSTPMELGAIRGEEVDRNTGEESWDPEGRVKELEAQLAALLSTPGRHTLSTPWRRPGVPQRGAERSVRREWVELNPQQRRDRFQECERRHLCHKCMRPGHGAPECRSTWRPKADASPV